MISLLPLGYGLAAFYGALGLFILRLARKPSCRICLYRDYCPNRLRGPSQFAEIPKCVQRVKTGDVLARRVA